MIFCRFQLDQKTSFGIVEGPDHLQSVVATHQAFQDQPSTVAILNVGGMHYRRQQQPQLYPLATM